VTTHAAFGYLAVKYGMHQIGIAGANDEAEPTPRALADASDYVRSHHVRTVYVEPLASQAISKTVARESGARTAVLDPVESVTKGHDYLSIMRSNLRTLLAGQPC
jgi:zinc transport system substrate-binding protein